MKLKLTVLLFAFVAGFAGQPQVGMSSDSPSSDPKKVNQDLNQEKSIAVKAVEFDFNIRGLVSDLKATRVIVWGKKGGRGQGGFSASLTGPDEVAIVDLSQLQILCQETLTAGIATATIDDKFAYIVPRSGNLIYRFDRDTLRKSKRKFFDAPVSVLAATAKGSLNVFFMNSRQSPQTIDRETLESLPSAGISTRGIQMGHPAQAFGLPGGQRMQLDRVVDAKTGQMKMLLNATKIRYVNLVDPTGFHHASGFRNQYGAKRYGRFFTGSAIISQTGQQLGQMNVRGSQGQGVVSESNPVVYSLRTARSRSRSTGTKTYLETRAIKNGNIIDSQLLSGMATDGNLKIVNVSESQLLIQGEKQVYSLQLPKLDARKAVWPLHFTYVNVAPWNASQKKSIPLSVKGAQGSTTFELTREYEGIEINSSTGEVKIDTPKVWRSFVDRIEKRLANPRQLRPMNWMSKEMLAIAESEHGFNTPAGHTPVVIPIGVSAVDSSGERDTLDFYGIVFVDKRPLDEKIKAAIAKMSEEQAAAKQKERSRTAGQSRGGERVGEGRVAELETRIRRLEAMLDAILLKLDRLKK